MDPRIMRVSVLLTAGVMIIGAVGTWATADLAAGISISVNGTDSGHDGVIVVVCAALLILAALVRNKALRILGIVAAVAAAATCIYDLVDIQDTTGIEVGWGLWVALIASVVAVVDAVVLMVVSGRQAAPPPAAGGDAPPPVLPGT
jgi:hypothetical protein